MLRQPIFSTDREKVVTGAVSEWIIAVVVVGLASLIFVIAFGTTMVIIVIIITHHSSRLSLSQT